MNSDDIEVLRAEIARLEAEIVRLKALLASLAAAHSLAGIDPTRPL